MKKILFLTLFMGLLACTPNRDASLHVECPCIVTKIDKINESVYRVYVNSTVHGDDDFSFYSRRGNEYVIGEIIK